LKPAWLFSDKAVHQAASILERLCRYCYVSAIKKVAVDSRHDGKASQPEPLTDASEPWFFSVRL